MTTDARDVQRKNVKSSMAVTPSGMAMDVSDVQSLNADLPMAVTPSGMAMDVRDLQPSKAPSPMEVRLSGSCTAASCPLSSQKAQEPTDVTPSSITTLCTAGM